MGRLLSITVPLLLVSLALAATGGPDDAGMTSVDSDEADGPSHAWLDASGGTAYALADDETVTILPEGTALEGLLRGYASEPGTGAVSFATDGGNLAQLGMEPLVFGPGSIDVAHKADAYIDVGELHRAVEVITALAASRCG